MKSEHMPPNVVFEEIKQHFSEQRLC